MIPIDFGLTAVSANSIPAIALNVANYLCSTRAVP
jgi:hypothetical protein